MKYFNVKVNGKIYEVEVEEVAAAGAKASNMVESSSPVKVEKPRQNGRINIEAPMQGKIIAVKVAEGDNIKEGDVVAILEAMKMENEITASKSGVVASIQATSGQMVDVGDVIISLA